MRVKFVTALWNCDNRMGGLELNVSLL